MRTHTKIAFLLLLLLPSLCFGASTPTSTAVFRNATTLAQLGTGPDGTLTFRGGQIVASGGGSTTVQNLTFTAGDNMSIVGDDTNKSVTFSAVLPWVDVRTFGAKCDGTTDDTAAWNSAIAYAIASPDTRAIRFAGRSKVTSTLQINARGLQIFGDQGSDAGSDSVSSIEYYGTGPAIQMGTDDGFAWDGTDLVAHPRSLYNGYQGFTLRNMRLRYAGSATTLLLNGLGAYGTDTYGLRDWRGGLVVLDNVDIVGFEYGFWGVQSDVDTWEKVILANNHVGAFFGPRSDQFTFNTGWTTGNDTSLVFDGAWSAEIHHVTSDNDGSATTSAYSLQANYSRSTGHIIFNDCWFENYGGYAGVIPSFVDAGVGATYKVRNVQFKSPHIITSVSPATPHTSYLATLGNVEDVVITDPYGRLDSGSLPTDSLLNFVGSTSPNSILVRYGSIAIGTPYVNSGTGNPSVTFIQTKSPASGYGGMSLIGQSAITTDGNNVPQIRLNDSDSTAASTHIRSNYDGANGIALSVDPVPATSAGLSETRFFRNVTAAAAKLSVHKGDGTGTAYIILNGTTGNVTATTFSATSGGSANHAICWKADGKTLGYCSAVVASDGTCGTCQ